LISLHFALISVDGEANRYNLKDAHMPGKVLELRQLLREKFPGLRTHLSESPAVPRNFWPTGVEQIDEPLNGGLPKGALTEIVAEKRGSGSALLARTLIDQAFERNEFVAFVDGQDSLDVTELGEDLSRLLWVRCGSADEALKATDLLLRDGNLPLIFLDLAENPTRELRKIPATTWYRFQRLIEQSSTVCVVMAPRTMISPAQIRITLRPAFSLDALERGTDELLPELKIDVTDTRPFLESAKPLERTA
jgi:hypothetical protein